MKAENITNRFGLKEATIEKIIAVFSQYPNIQKVLLYPTFRRFQRTFQQF